MLFMTYVYVVYVVYFLLAADVSVWGLRVRLKIGTPR